MRAQSCSGAMPNRKERGFRVAGRAADATLLGLAVCAVPVSIALSETLLACSLLFRVMALALRRAKPYLPRVFWAWAAWAVLEVAAWLASPDRRAGLGEMRHLALAAVLFLLVPALEPVADRVAAWRGAALGATLSSLFLIGHFARQLVSYHGTSDPVLYLRSGGLLHHWMVYGTVEILVFAGLLELWHFYPEHHRRLLPVLAVNVIAIVLSLTRMLWITCLALLVLDLVWRRSRWILAVPVMLCALFFLVPGAVRSRLSDSVQPDYYSNSERLQMLRVGWKMIRDKPLTGVGPGRVEELYTQYLALGDPVPAYHGHLHNNPVQLAAAFGLPAAIAAAVFAGFLFVELRRRYLRAEDRDAQFLCRTALLSLTGFLLAGMFDYTYGHSLGIILLSFAVLAPLVPPPDRGIRET